MQLSYISAWRIMFKMQNQQQNKHRMDQHATHNLYFQIPLTPYSFISISIIKFHYQLKSISQYHRSPTKFPTSTNHQAISILTRSAKFNAVFNCEAESSALNKTFLRQQKQIYLQTDSVSAHTSSLYSICMDQIKVIADHPPATPQWQKPINVAEIEEKTERWGNNSQQQVGKMGKSLG